MAQVKPRYVIEPRGRLFVVFDVHGIAHVAKVYRTYQHAFRYVQKMETA